MIVADSGVWIDYFNNVKNKASETLSKLISEDVEIGVNYLIICEVLQGKLNEKKYQETKEILDSFKLLEINYDTIILASNIFRACQRGIKTNNITGQTIKTIDCIIASNCIEYDLELLHRDTHFDFISKIIGQLKIYKE